MKDPDESLFFNDEEDVQKTRQHLFSRHIGKHVKPRQWFYKPKSIWGWIEQAIQTLCIIMGISFIVLLILGAFS